MSEFLAAAGVADWPDIPGYLHPEVNPVHVSALEAAKRGVAFVTYDYGIDGVSIEISKYADCCEALLSDDDRSTPIHIIGGEFYEQADTVIRPHWKRFQIEGVNGWSKWDGGKWFSKLFYEDMPGGSEVSREMAVEIWTQAVSIARRLAKYVSSEGIGLLVPVNINSNPGNPAYALGLVLVSEYLGIYVINSNHDFLWEGRTPYSRGGDGKSWLGPVLREYIVSEAMHHLGIPTTRALAAVATGEAVYRETVWPGAVFTRVASSHLRVGTFEYFAARRNTDALKTLTEYAIDRHYPEAKSDEVPYVAFFRCVAERQAELIAGWQSASFMAS